MLTLNLKVMKALLFACIFSIAALGYSQDKQPTFKVENDLVKATYYYEDGSVQMQGYFKDKKLTGKWTMFDIKGNKIQTGYYKNGKKINTWFVWSKDSLKEITYNDNSIVNVNLWKHDAVIVAK
jgi:hypothetical protein